MNFQIRKVAVLGSGVMGAGIAALLTNVGIPVRLLDMVPQSITKDEQDRDLSLAHKEVRNRFAAQSLVKLKRQKPAPLTSLKNVTLIEIGNFEDDIHRIADCDWVIEAVVENLPIKKQILSQVDQFRKPNSIISSNTSGISVNAMVEDRTADFCAHFLGTHFFNPPRYLKLLELIPTATTNPAVTQFMQSFGEDVLGKGIVIAKDTPNFIGNRIGTYGMMLTIQQMLESNLTIGEVDSLTGKLIGRPKSATFRTLDVVGLDTFSFVLQNLLEHLPDERAMFIQPAFMQEMLVDGKIGSKAGRGFYKKQGGEILEWDWQSGLYVATKTCDCPSVKLAKQEKDFAKRIRNIVAAEDQAGRFLWSILSGLLLYTANHVNEIADDIVAIDRAMKWGFGWEYGVFEIWDALGLQDSVARMEEEGHKVPEWIKDMIHNGQFQFYQDDEHYFPTKGYLPTPKDAKQIDVDDLTVIFENNGGRLLDMGDGIAMLDFCSPNNAIGIDFMDMIVRSAQEVDSNYRGLVIGNQSNNFCVGANLALMLLAAQDEDSYEIDRMIHKFQQATMAIKYCAKPVVTAPYQMTLGGGAELCLPAAYRQVSSETYIGLVEVGVGLIPAGGGCKELYCKNLSAAGSENVDYLKIATRTFETIALAKVSASAAEAHENGYVSPSDGVSMNQDHLLYHAKKAALFLADKGYQAPVRSLIPVAGETGFAAMLMSAKMMHTAGHISDHDYLIAEKLATIISGGQLPYGTGVSEQYLLDLERKAFLELIMEPKTQARMQHMLLTKKPLRN